MVVGRETVPRPRQVRTRHVNHCTTQPESGGIINYNSSAWRHWYYNNVEEDTGIGYDDYGDKRALMANEKGSALCRRSCSLIHTSGLLDLTLWVECRISA